MVCCAQALAQEVACYLGLDLSGIKIKRFADGEIYVQVQVSPRPCLSPWLPPASAHLRPSEPASTQQQWRRRTGTGCLRGGECARWVFVGDVSDFFGSGALSVAAMLCHAHLHGSPSESHLAVSQDPVCCCDVYLV